MKKSVRSFQSPKLSKWFLAKSLMSLVAISACNKDTVDTLLPQPEVAAIAIKDGEAEAADFTLLLGTTKNLAATVTPAEASQEVTWSSSDAAIVSVSAAGVVKAEKVGIAVVMAASKSDPAKKASVTVTAKEPPVSGIVIKDGEAEAADFVLPIDTTKTLVASAEPANANQEAIWSSSDSTIVSVKAGVVKTKRIGRAVITAMAKSDSAKRDSVAVTVEPRVTSVTIKNSKGTEATDFTLPFTSTKNLAATVMPAEASQEVTWSSSAAAIVSVSADGTVQAKGAGSAVITATSKSNPYKKASVTVTVGIVVIIKEGGARVDGVNFNLIVDETKTFSAFAAPNDTINPSAEITWTSSAPDKATVDAAGVVTAIAVGKTTITATSTQEPTQKASVSITIEYSKREAKGYAKRDYQELAGTKGTLASLNQIKGLGAKVKENWGAYYTTLFTKNGQPVDFTKLTGNKFDCWAIFVARSYVHNSTRTSGVQIEITLENGVLKAKALWAKYTYRYWDPDPRKFNFDKNGINQSLATSYGEPGYAVLDLSVFF